MTSIRHIVAFISVRGQTEGAGFAEYARQVFASEQVLAPEDEAATFFERFRCVQLPLVDRAAALSRLPADVAEELTKKERCLTRQISRVESIPSGEQLVANYATVLSDVYDVFPAGTVVVIRQTDVATLAFLCPDLRIDVNTGVLTELPVPVDDQRPTPHLVLSNTSSGQGLDADSWVQIGLTTATTLSFGLPPPFGVVIAGLLTFLSGGLQGIFGEKDDPFDDLYQRLERDKVGEWMTDARSLVEHINRQTDVMAKNPPTALQVITDMQWYPSLEPYITPGRSHLYTTLFEFPNLDQFIERKNEFFGLMTCVSIYLFGVKWGLYLKAYAASEYAKQKDAARYHEFNWEWRSDYTGFVDDIQGGQRYQGWVSRVNTLIDQRIQYRLSKISQVTRVDFEGLSGPSVGHGLSMATQTHEWRWDDSGDLHIYSDEHPKNSPVIDHHDKAVHDREEHYKAVLGEQNNLYADARQLTNSWTDSINQWSSHLPPGRPSTRPSLDPATFQQPVPADSIWAKHQDQWSVVYAVAYYNRPDQANDLDKPKTALISAWSDPVVIKGASPLVANVPVDDLKMAIGRHVYRKFIPVDGSAALQPVLVGQISDNTTTTWRDA